MGGESETFYPPKRVYVANLRRRGAMTFFFPPIIREVRG